MEMRKHERLEIESPVTVGLKVMAKGSGIEFGQLCDIGEQGARFHLERPLSVNTGVNLLVHFRDPSEQIITLGFDAVVTRASQTPPYEIAVRFRGEPMFIRGDLSEMLKHGEKQPGRHQGDCPQHPKHGKGKAGHILFGKYTVN